MGATVSLLPARREMEQAFRARDPGYDGVFFVAVQTTGIFCRPSCPSRPKREHIKFFATVRDAMAAGYRPCKRCHPLDFTGAPPPWVADLLARVEAAPDVGLKAADLRSLGSSPERVRRWFLEHYGMSFAAWCRGRRLAAAFTQIREGVGLDDAALACGYESLSGFREAFGKTFGAPPGKSRQDHCIVTTVLETPLGPVLAAATRDRLCLLEFTDQRTLQRHCDAMRRRFRCAVLPGGNAHLNRLREELARYFAGERHGFTVPLVPQGTEFQERVWAELRRIPYGSTISYQELARRIGQPTAVRAVARAIGTNHINILIPCHRVVGSDGHLTGYGGGVWRKRLLLALERSGRLPGSG